MKAVVILAAGMGTRLYPLTEEKPKTMVEVGGKPILEWQIEAYISSGISSNNIHVVLGYKHEMVEEFIKSKWPNINVVLNFEYEKTNNMYSLLLALKKLEKTDVIVSNGDCIYDPEIVREFVLGDNRNAIACDVGKYNEESMKVVVKSERIIHISKEIPEKDAFGLSIDLYRIASKDLNAFKEIVKEIVEENPKLWAEVALDKLLKLTEFYPFDIKNRKWIEIDDMRDLELARNLF